MFLYWFDFTGILLLLWTWSSQLIHTCVSGVFKLNWQPLVRMQKGLRLIVPQALGSAISRLSLILHWRLGPELRQEGRPGQWLHGSGPCSRKMRETGPGPPSYSALWKNTQGPRDMTGISNTAERKRMGRGCREGDRNNCFLGLPSKPSTWDHWLVWPFSLLLHPLLSSISDFSVTEEILVSVTRLFPAEPARLRCFPHIFQIQSEKLYDLTGKSADELFLNSSAKQINAMRGFWFSKQHFTHPSNNIHGRVQLGAFRPQLWYPPNAKALHSGARQAPRLLPNWCQNSASLIPFFKSPSQTLFTLLLIWTFYTLGDILCILLILWFHFSLKYMIEWNSDFGRSMQFIKKTGASWPISSLAFNQIKVHFTTLARKAPSAVPPALNYWTLHLW